jgi:hypothetical protein
MVAPGSANKKIYSTLCSMLLPENKPSVIFYFDLRGFGSKIFHICSRKRLSLRCPFASPGQPKDRIKK